MEKTEKIGLIAFQKLINNESLTDHERNALDDGEKLWLLRNNKIIADQKDLGLIDIIINSDDANNLFHTKINEAGSFKLKVDNKMRKNFVNKKCSILIIFEDD